VSFGAAQITYMFKETPKNKGRRCWLIKVDEQGNKTSKSSKAKRCDGSEITLAEGRYLVRTWKTLGSFEETFFDVILGQATSVSVRQK